MGSDAASIIASRRFGPADQDAFARLSGDWNPIHMDAVAARRLLPGAVVVHGVHGVLWALETLMAKGAAPRDLAGVSARFAKFIPLEADVELVVVERNAVGLKAVLRLQGSAATTLSLSFGPPEADPAARGALPPVRPSTAPRDLDLGEMDGAAAWLTPAGAPGEAAGLFPHLTAALGAERVAGAAQASAVVGMECPGLHSLFSELSLRFTAPGRHPAGLGYSAQVSDPRYPRVRLTLTGDGLSGSALALVRPAPVPPPAMAAVEALVTPGEFQGRRALVVGGSRGLGAATAMLLAAGGAQVTLTYASGAQEAAELVAEIDARPRSGPTRAVWCDARRPYGPEMAAALSQATDIYYFATAHITRQGTAAYSPELFAEFCEVYVDGFHTLCRQIPDPGEGGGVRVFYPSTVFLDQRPRGMGEYAMSKAAGEQLCQELARAAPHLAVQAPRLPRVRTDQSASPLPIQAADPVEVMLPYVRAPAGT